eukprot:CAMPEP_0171459078 /NCGR_PEP_ID=MMETSP0945-20130129/4503_1 /TAXON_ID=109269 /ORGANISM="Vaucheria litorea, Strain CCMP2940" /LENGTH=485 /DNA_ID=CAMNT_0011985019 /DNA_START=135 /DNA_END=1592 /DNA_ORIENTATION=+
MFSPNDSPENDHKGSFIKLTDLTFTRKVNSDCFLGFDGTKQNAACVNEPGKVDIAIIEEAQSSYIGKVVNKTRHYCCTDEASDLGACNSSMKNRLITKENNFFHQILEVPLNNGIELSDPAYGTFNVNKTAMYKVVIANCDPRNGIIEMNGHTEWMNPYGYLPGEMYHALPYFLVLSILYIVLGAFWYLLSCITFRHLQAIHFWISLVLFMGMVETAAKYYDYFSWNENGVRGSMAIAWGLIFGVTKRTLSRVLVVMVSMGYGSIRPTLGSDFKLVAIVGGSYWCVGVLSEMFEGAPSYDVDVRVDPGMIEVSAMLAMGTILLDTCFYAWTFHSLSFSIYSLSSKNQHERAKPFRAFMAVLVVGLIFSGIWAMFGAVQTFSHRDRSNWKEEWAYVAIWEVVYLYLLVAICVLLRPRLDGSQFFGYSAVEMTERRYDYDQNNLEGEAFEEEMEYGGRVGENEDEFQLLPNHQAKDEMNFARGKHAD